MIRFLLGDADADEGSGRETENDVNDSTQNDSRLLFVHEQKASGCHRFQNALASQDNAYLRHDSHTQYDREDSNVRNYSKSLIAPRCSPPGAQGVHLPAPPQPPPLDDQLQFFKFLGLESHSFLSVSGAVPDVNLADLMPQHIG
jgi:hypothetical protein